MSDNQYNSFIKNLQNVKKGNSMSFCRDRQKEIEEAFSKKHIMLQEVNKYEDKVSPYLYKHPTKLLPPEYVLENYSPNIFINELKDIHSQFFNDNCIVKIAIDKCDHLEGIKQIIDNYLGYMVELNFESIINSLRKINIIEKQVQQSHYTTSILRKKISEFRNKILVVSSKFLLYKQRYKNIVKLLEIGKTYLLKWYNDLGRSNIFFERKMFYNANNVINENIGELKKLGFLNRLIIFQNISRQLNEKIISLQKICDNIFTNIFLNQNENYKDFFLYNIHLSSSEEFLKVKIKIINKEEIKKISDFQKYFNKLEENKFISSLHQTLANLVKVSENFLYYFEQHKQMKFSTIDEENKNEIYFNLLDKNKHSFLEIIEKKLTKLYMKLIETIRTMNHKNLLYFVLFNSIFLDYSISIFELNISNSIKDQIRICVCENIKYHNTQLVKNVFTLLENDNWKRVPMSDTKIFDEEKLKDFANFPFKLLISIFNPHSSIINNSNSKKYFYLVFQSWNTNSINQILNEFSHKDYKIQVFSKNLDSKSLIFSTSSVNLIISMKQFIVYLNCFDSIIYDTFIQIFNTFDYYILSGILMIIQKPFLQMLLQDINIEDMRKKTNNQSAKVEAYVESVLFQRYYQNVKKFVVKAKKNIECLLETEIDLFAQNSSIFPKLNKQIFVNEQNSYSLMIENIIMLESFHSIYEVLKRFSVFIDKINSDFQRKIIKDEITAYKKLLNDLSTFMFKPICYNIFKIEPILNKIIKFKWDLKETDSANQLHEANSFVDSIFLEILEKYEKLDFLSSGSITESSKKKFLVVMISYFKDKLMDSFSKIKNCSSTGRSIMLKDVKFFKSKLEEKFKIDISWIIRELEMYVNSWYSDEEQFLQYILEQELNYRYMHSIVNTGGVFSKLDKQAKKNLITSIENTYISLVENLIKNIK